VIRGVDLAERTITVRLLEGLEDLSQATPEADDA
jgi:hypothetical protein